MKVRALIASLVLCALALVSTVASAQDLRQLAQDLKSPDKAQLALAVDAIAKSSEPAALALLEALAKDALRIDAKGTPFVAGEAGQLSPVFVGAGKPDGSLYTPLVDNRLRRQLEPALASLKLGFPDPQVRLSAAKDLAKSRNDDLAPLLRSAAKKESDPEIRTALQLALAQTDLRGTDKQLRLAALMAIEDAADASFKPDLEKLSGKDSGGTWSERDEDVRRAAGAALSAIELRLLWLSTVANLFYGLSLGSVLLLCALGLAITFGLMRVINMAHGELLMIGAYATFSVQRFFQAYLPVHSDWYLIVAVPVAFVVAAGIGMALERTVIRFLYGRPLETLLATWGISLILIQTVRLIFGAQNVAVANPSYLAGGIEVLPGFVLTYSRLAVIAFASAVVAFVWFMLRRTPLGLHVRAVTQNREMAAGMGIATRRVDVWTFGIGSGVAGLGGVALSQLGNVGPELGQQYIVDSFMVVVLGGVGKLAGTLAGAFGLGIVNKLLEPAAGAVLGKIVILGFIILFIQRRPQGIFALKGRAAEAT
ncbi:MAG TPA: urea ABC transporter permease subunit UrtB [Polyangiaceae bacterium]|nr:urea ABC transporter permease subunit UrtB [Polyangiaceae bacterium]